jgi:hypothetical protein
LDMLKVTRRVPQTCPRLWRGKGEIGAAKGLATIAKILHTEHGTLKARHSDSMRTNARVTVAA